MFKKVYYDLNTFKRILFFYYYFEFIHLLRSFKFKSCQHYLKSILIFKYKHLIKL